MNKLVLVVALLFITHIHAQNSVSPDDLRILIGDWTGSLTYVDYSSGQPFTMPANVKVEQGKNENQFILFYAYPNEPKANNKEKVTISNKGSKINGNDLISSKSLNTDETQFTTESPGKDNNKKALIRNIYVVGEERFLIRKEVRFEGSEEWLKRNEFSFKRNKQ